jgi:hypothetical protein
MIKRTSLILVVVLAVLTLLFTASYVLARAPHTDLSPPMNGASVATVQSDGGAGRGGDFLISTALDRQDYLAMAHNATDDEYLVAWADQRNRGDSGFDIYGQIYSTQGVPQGEPIPISAADGAQDFPAVAWNSAANEYLIVWMDMRGGTDYDVYGQFINATGTLSGTNFAINTDADDQEPEDLVYDPNADHYLVVWVDDGDNRVEGQLLDSAGGLIGSNAFAISGAGGDHPRAAYNSNRNSYMVVYAMNGDIYGQAIAGDGGLTGSAFVICDNAAWQSSPDLEFNSNPAVYQYLVVWQDERKYANTGRDLYAQRIDEDGNLQGEIIISDAEDDQLGPAVAYNPDANQYLVTWNDYRSRAATGPDIYGQRVKADGSLATQGNFAIATATGYQMYPKVVYSTTSHQYLVAWHGYRDSGTSGADIYGQRLHWLVGIPLGYEFNISAARESHEEPDVAYNSTDHEYLVVWADDRDGDGETDIWGQRYDRDGLPLGENFVVREEAGNETRPVVAYNPAENNYLVVWDDVSEEDIEGQLVSAQGSQVGVASNISGGSRPALAYNSHDNQYLVVFQYEAAAGNRDIHGRRVAADGTFPSNEFVICDNPSDQLYPDVTYAAINAYLVVWSDKRDDEGDILGRRVWANEMLPGNEIVIAQDADAQTFPAAVWNSTASEYLVAWHDYRDSGTSGADIYGQRVNSVGVLEGNNFAICAADGDQQYPYVNHISANNRYYVGWQDDRSGTVDGWDLYGQWVAADGSLAGFNLPVFRYHGWQIRPTGAYNPDDDGGLTVWQDGRNGAEYKIYGRLGALDLEPPTAAFNYGPSTGDTNSVYTFNAGPSRDNVTPGGALLVRWDWEGDGTYDTGLSLSKWMTHTYAAAGTYSVCLEVWDLMWLTDTITHTVTVLAPTANTPPTATLAVTPTSAVAGTALQFDASGSTDAESPGNLQVRWDWENDGEWDTGFGTTLTATHAYTIASDHTIRVEVQDDGGLTNATTGNATVLPSAVTQLEVAPAAVTMMAGEVVQFRASAWDAYDNEMTDPDVTWSVTDSGAGTIDSSGLFTASTQAGMYPGVIQAESNSVLDTASVTIVWPYQIYLPSVVCNY